MEYTVKRAEPGDEAILAYIQTESWKEGFKDILSADTLLRYTQIDKATEMYRRLLENNVGNGYLMTVEGVPHCIAWWGRAREEDMPEYAELICIHSLKNKWRQGFGTGMMDCVLDDVKNAGFSKIMLWVFKDNLRARRFYEKLGFRENGRVKSDLDATEVCYERAL